MKGLKVAVVILAITTLGLGGYVVYKEFINKEEPVNVTEYETKISNLETENKKLKEDIEALEDEECPETKCEPSVKLPKFTGTYTFGDPNQKDTCGDTPDKIFQYEIEFYDDGTAYYSTGLKCGSGYGGSGKVYYSEDEIIILNDDWEWNMNGFPYAIFNYNGDKITKDSEHMGKKYTLELIKK